MSKSFSIQLARNVTLDALGLVDTRMLVAGSSGSGKSYAMRVIAEQAAPKLQTIILDPEGEYTTLREKVDVVIVGTDGEVVPTTQTAAKLARKLLELQVSAVVDLYDLKIQERRAFVRRFLDSLMSVPKKLWRPCIVMLDEAHKFCPERSSGQAESTEAVITLLSQGRKRGFCGILSTQRLQKLHKDAAAETLNNLIGRTSLDTDVRRARDILGLAKADEGKLRALKPGNWYGFGPAFVDVDGVCQFKAKRAETTHPEPGKRHKLRAPAPSARIQRVLPELAELPQQAEQEAKDLASLQRRVRELERDLKKAQRGTPTAKPDPQATERAVQRAVAQERRQHERFLKNLYQQTKKLSGVVEKAATSIMEIRGFQSLLLEQIQATPVPQEPVSAPPTKAPRVAPTPSTPPSSNGALGGGMRRIMLAVVSSGGATRTDVAILAQMAPSSGTFATYLGRLKKSGYLIDESGELVPTDAGIAALGDHDPIPVGGERLVSSWQGKLGSGGIRRLFDALAEAGSDGLQRQDLAIAAGLEPTSGTFATYIGRLRKKGLVVGRWPLQLAPVFFQ